MKKYTEWLQPEKTYHVFNRGIAKAALFKNDNNYIYFLKKYHYYISPVADTLAFCLLNNHFHFLIRIKSVKEIRQNLHSRKHQAQSIEAINSRQFANFFNGYAQAYNKMFQRNGGLFEEPFRRKEYFYDDDIKYLIAYIHLNPLKHRFTKNYQEYPYSSYNHLINLGRVITLPTLDAETTISYYTNLEKFIEYHQQLEPYIIEHEYRF
jgi:REP element-mobilizing transposase RayT